MKTHKIKATDTALGQKTQAASTATKTAAPLTDAEWAELKQLREMRIGDEQRKHLDTLRILYTDELTSEDQARLTELTDRVYEANANGSATAALAAVLAYEIPDLKRRLDASKHEVMEAQMRLGALEAEHQSLERELVVCESIQDRIPPVKSPAEEHAFGVEFKRLGRLLKSAAGQWKPGEGSETAKTPTA